MATPRLTWPSGAEIVKIIKVEKQLSSQNYTFVKKKLDFRNAPSVMFLDYKKKQKKQKVFEGVFSLHTNLPPFI